jgi:hypothetical protein
MTFYMLSLEERKSHNIVEVISFLNCGMIDPGRYVDACVI